MGRQSPESGGHITNSWHGSDTLSLIAANICVTTLTVDSSHYPLSCGCRPLPCRAAPPHCFIQSTFRILNSGESSAAGSRPPWLYTRPSALLNTARWQKSILTSLTFEKFSSPTQILILIQTGVRAYSARKFKVGGCKEDQCSVKGS